MPKQFPSRASSVRRSCAAARRHFRPRVEPLEARCLLATGIFIENFSSDVTPDQPGFDSAADDFRIAHEFVQFGDGYAFVHAPTAVGPGGEFMSPPHSLFLNDVDRITFPDMAADEFINLARVNVFVSALRNEVRFIARDGRRLTVTLPPGGPQAVIATNQTLADDGLPLGPIQFLEVRGIELLLDDVRVLVTRNFVPEPQNDLAFAAPQETIDIDVLANDLSSSIDPLVIDSVAAPAHGQAAVAGSLIRYVAATGFQGLDSFTYTVRDTFGETATATVHVQVVAPLAADDREFTLPGVPVTIDVLENDTVPGHHHPLTVVSATDPLGGFVTVAGDHLVYTPNAGFHGRDSFSYTVRDPFGNSASATVRVTVNTPPTAVDAAFTLPHHFAGPLTIPAPGLLAGATDPDDDPLQLVAGTQTVPEGLVTLQADGSFTLVPDTPDGLLLPTSFAFVVEDALGGRSVGRVDIHVENTPPVALDTSRGFHALPVQFSIRYDDADSDVVTPEIVVPPNRGTLSLRYGGIDPLTGHSFIEVEYTAAGDLLAHDVEFTYRLRDRYEVSEPATVRIVSVNTAPLGSVDRYELDYDGRDPLAPSFDSPVPVLANDFDVELDRLEAVLVTPPAHGRLEYLLPDGQFRYLPPEAPFHPDDPFIRGRDSFTYRVSDGVASSPPVEVVIAIRDNGVGQTEDDVYETPVGTRLLISAPGVLANDEADPNLGDPRLARLVAPPRHGTLELDASGAFLYQPDPGFRGSDYFSYHTTDLFVQMGGNGAGRVSQSAEAWVQIIVNSPSDRDADGISNIEEDALGSGNGNRVPDSQEPHVVTLETDAGVMTLAASNRFNSLTQLAAFAEVNHTLAPPTDPPPGYDFPLGYFSFRLDIPFDPSGAGFPAQYVVRIFTPDPLPAGTTFLKYGGYRDIFGDPLPPRWYQPNDVAVFDWGQGRHGIEFTVQDGGQGDSDYTENGIILDPGGIAVPRAPRIESVQINDGHVQRSMITNLTVAFSEVVAFEPGAFDLRRVGSGQPVDVRVMTTTVAGRTIAELSFAAGRNVKFGSLVDGRFRLTIHADRIQGAAGRPLDGDGDGAPGGDYIDEFFRRFGDTDGDGDLDRDDKSVFLATYGQRRSQPGYLWYLDANGNGRIYAEDLALFLLGYGRKRFR